MPQTLSRLGPSPPAAGRILRAARESGIGLEAVDMPSRDARDLYEAPLALIRPDQVVAWRGFDDEDAAAVLGILLGGVPKGGA